MNAALRNNQTVVVLAQADRSVRTLQDLRDRIASMGGPERRLAFRGYYVPDNDRSNAPRALMTGLDHLWRQIDEGGPDSLPGREGAIVREFMRRAHHYLADVPENGSWFEWLALMQHHGAPTRLLDWTYSPAIAVHFALAHASRTRG
jgi:hypothetical protein